MKPALPRYQNQKRTLQKYKAKKNFKKATTKNYRSVPLINIHIKTFHKIIETKLKNTLKVSMAIITYSREGSSIHANQSI